jgi:regulation of enolase protein 1 (concanavalin A-like superfamily)
MVERLFREDFDRPEISPSLYWFNEPGDWRVEGGCLVINPEKTDFWQKTHYGFEYDNGHCLFYRSSGDFVLSTRVRFFPKHQYDQAGLMVRVSEDYWLKTSVEYEDETLSRLGVVVTNFGYSDWSTQDFDPEKNEIELRVSKSGQDCLVEFKLGDSPWSQMRMAHLHRVDDVIQAGIYACSPVDVGYTAEFDFLEIAASSQR